MMPAPVHAPRRLLQPVQEMLGIGLTRLSADSRRVAPGIAFAAYPGERSDGRNFIHDAIERGASAVLWESAGFAWNHAWRVPNLGLVDLRAWVSRIADELYDQPSHKLWVIGVTGTNGKTSCGQWLGLAFAGAGKRSAIIGTLGNGMHDALQPSPNTTPDAIVLQEQLAAFVAQGASHVSIEVSSHGLEQGRVSGVKFDGALFTNLTHDHLDYHGNMERYFAAKSSLFLQRGLKFAVINLDDDYGQRLAHIAVGTGVAVVGYGFDTSRAQALAQHDNFSFCAGSDLRADARGLRFAVRSPWGDAHLQPRVLGRYNAHNLLGVYGCLLVSGMQARTAAEVVDQAQPIRGRMQTVGGGAAPLAVVDYAHSPDALANVLTSLREIVPPGGRLITVFGCGGERDAGKRPLMGSIAAKLADAVIVTSDNPRGEPAEQIIEQIRAGVGAAHVVETDRARAIEQAVHGARAGDVVLIAGKGHEEYQEIAGTRHPFSDFAHARAALLRWHPGATGQGDDGAK